MLAIALFMARCQLFSSVGFTLSTFGKSHEKTHDSSRRAGC
jgi:hypothetical protein